jgi:phosphate/sulfate permease
MKTLIGGAIAAALGLVGLVIWWGKFLIVLTGIIPAMLLLGGALAIYLGFDELKDTRKDDETVESPPESSEGEDVDKYKKEIDDLKGEIETLKKD